MIMPSYEDSFDEKIFEEIDLLIAEVLRHKNIEKELVRIFEDSYERIVEDCYYIIRPTMLVRIANELVDVRGYTKSEEVKKMTTDILALIDYYVNL